MKHWENLSLENIIEEIDGIIYTEQWQGIVAHNGIYIGAYEVSDFGRVKSLARVTGDMPNGGKQVRRALILKQRKDKYGYLTVGLYAKDRKVHRLVALTFILNPENKPQVNHLFGIKTDNRVWKLEWATGAEDKSHAKRIGLRKKIAENHPDAKLTNMQVLEIFNSELPYKEIAKLYNIIPDKVSLIKTGKIWGSVTGKKYQAVKGVDKHIVISVFNSSLSKKDISIIYGISRAMVGRIKNKVRYQSITNQLKTA